MKNKRYIDVVWELFEELLEENNLETALARSLEILVRALHSEEGVIWLLDRNANELVPMFHTGRLDLSNFRAGLGEDLESFVTKSGESVLLTDVAGDRLHLILPKDNPEYHNLPGIAMLIGGLWVANLYYWGFNQYIIQRRVRSTNP